MTLETPKKKRKSGIPTGNAGEYFVMGELLRRGFDAQLADRNTAGYDMLVGRATDKALRKLQVKSVRIPPWFVRRASFEGDELDEVTVYVVIGKEDAKKPVRYFIARNRDIAPNVQVPATWKDSNASAYLPLFKGMEVHEDKWNVLFE